MAIRIPTAAVALFFLRAWTWVSENKERMTPLVAPRPLPMMKHTQNSPESNSGTNNAETKREALPNTPAQSTLPNTSKSIPVITIAIPRKRSLMPSRHALPRSFDKPPAILFDDQKTNKTKTTKRPKATTERKDNPWSSGIEEARCKTVMRPLTKIIISTIMLRRQETHLTALIKAPPWNPTCRDVIKGARETKRMLLPKQTEA